MPEGAVQTILVPTGCRRHQNIRFVGSRNSGSAPNESMDPAGHPAGGKTSLGEVSDIPAGFKNKFCGCPKLRLAAKFNFGPVRNAGRGQNERRRGRKKGGREKTQCADGPGKRGSRAAARGDTSRARIRGRTSLGPASSLTFARMSISLHFQYALTSLAARLSKHAPKADRRYTSKFGNAPQAEFGKK